MFIIGTHRSMKFVERRPFSDPDTVAGTLIEIANGAEAVQDDRIYIERITRRFSRLVAAARISEHDSSVLLHSAGCGGTRAAPT